MNAQRWRLLITLAIIAAAVSGLLIPKGEKLSGVMSVFSNIKLGLDIKGGVRLEYRIDLQGKAQNSTRIVDDVYTVLRERLDAAGYTEASLKKAYKESGA